VLREKQVAFDDAVTACLAALTERKPILALEHQIILQCAEVLLNYKITNPSYNYQQISHMCLYSLHNQEGTSQRDEIAPPS